MPSLELAGLLYLGAALAVAPAALRRPEPINSLRRGGARLALAVVFGGAVGPALLVVALAHVPAATVSLLLNFELVATTIIAAIVFHEHLGRRFIAAAGLVTASGVMLVWQPGAEFEFAGLLVIAACFAWGIDNAATSRIDQLRPEQITFAKGAAAGTVNLLLGLLLAGFPGQHPGQHPDQIAAALAIGALGYGVSITLWVKGSQDLGAARAQVVFAAAPFVGALLSWTILGEQISATQLLALLAAAVGIGISLDSGHAHTHRHEPVEHEHEHRHDDDHHDHSHDPAVTGSHTHRHSHDVRVHEHPHVPDLHHGHRHT